jgi:hypothetical protein
MENTLDKNRKKGSVEMKNPLSKIKNPLTTIKKSSL